MGRGIKIMKVSPYVNEMLSKKYIQDSINNNEFKKLYKQLSLGEVPDVAHIGELTELLLAVGINPLNSLDYIPEYYLLGSTIDNISIPNNIRKIDYMSFAHCNNIVSVNFPASLETIGERAFYSCKSLNNVIIPGNVKIIEQAAFRHCDSLSNLTIEKGIEIIGIRAFDYCPLQYITYTGTIKDWKKIDISFNNSLNIITINCTDGEYNASEK